MDRAEIEELTRGIKEALVEGLKGVTGTGSELSKVLKDATDTAGKLDADKILKRFDKSVKKTSSELSDINKVIETFDEAISKTTDSFEKNELLNKKAVMLEHQKTQETKESIAATSKFTKGLTTATASLFSPIASGVGKLTSSLQSNASATDTSSALLGAGIDAAGGAMGATAKIVTKVGEAWKGTPIVGGIIASLGVAAEAAVEGLTKFLKFGNDVLSKEVTKTVKAFNDASTAGGVFADGMTGIRNASGEAGLTIEQFSGLIKKESRALAESGQGVVNGAKQVGRVGVIFDKEGGKIRSQLLKMGYGFEEQAEMTAKTMATMTRLDPNKKVTDAAVAEQTQKYAENLRIIAAITGEDAKKKSEETRNQANQLAFQQKLAKKSPEEQAKIMRAMEHMSKQQQMNFMDVVNFGAVINKNGAIMEANLPALAEMTREEKRRFDEGTLDADAQISINSQNQEAMKKQAMNAEGLATAAAAPGSPLAELASTILSTTQFINTYTKDASESSKKNVEEVKHATDELTTSVTNAAVAQQKMAVDIQKLMLPAISKYAEVSAKLLTVIEEQIREFMGVKPEKKSTATNDAERSDERRAIYKSEQEEKNKADREALTSEKEKGAFDRKIAAAKLHDAEVNLGMAKVNLTRPGGLEEYKKAEAEVARLQLPEEKGAKEGHAKGGIAKGPTTGFKSLLHGTEAVIPLEQGSIPIDFGKIPDLEVEKTPAESNADELRKSFKELSSYGTTISKFADLQQASTEQSSNRFNRAIAEMSGSMSKVPFDSLISAVAMIPGPVDKFSDSLISMPFKAFHDDLASFNAPMSKVTEAMLANVKAQNFQAESVKTFTEKLGTLPAETRAQTLQAMESMSKQEQANFMDMVNFGTVINKEGVQAAAMNKQLADNVTNSYEQFKAGKLTPESVQSEISKSPDIVKVTQEVALLGVKVDKTTVIAEATKQPDNSATKADLTSMLNEVSSTNKEQQTKTTSVFDTLQRYLQDMMSPTSGPTVSETEDQKSNQQLLAEIKKLSELLMTQNTLAEQANQYRKQLIDVTEDHKRVSDRIFEATS